MDIGFYEILSDGFIAGVFRRKGDKVEGTARSMRYLELAGQVRRLEPEKPAPAPAAESKPVAAEPAKKK